MTNNKEHNSTQAQKISIVASRWDHAIHQELNRFARHHWPNNRLWGLIPIHRFRLRKHLDSDACVWWVEHDIPPQDRYRCEAYCVELNLVGSGKPRLTVHSGTTVYPITPMSMDGLKGSLGQAGADSPLIIRRQFERAVDP